MNLVSDPWIPVIGHDGTSRNVSLMEALTEGEGIRDLAVNPVQRISVMRLLICIVQAALNGPEDEDDWLTCRNRIPDAASEYLKKWKTRFELYGKHAFLQVPKLEATRNETADKLEFGTATNEGSTLFDQFAPMEGRRHPPAWYPVQLLAYQCFSPGGTIGVSMWGGFSTKDRQSKTPQRGPGHSPDAPCIGSGTLHALIRGSNLSTSVWWNLLTKRQVRQMPGAGWGVPLWERFPASCADANIGTLFSSYLWRLVPLTRAIILEKDSPHMTLVNGCPFPVLPDYREPTGIVKMGTKAGVDVPRYVTYRPGQHVWRELMAVLVLRDIGAVGGPLSLHHLLTTENQSFDIWIGGIARRPGQYKLLDMAEWCMNIPTALLASSHLHVYEAGVALAERAAGLLKAGIKECFLKTLKLDKNQIPYATAETLFWSTLDAQHTTLLDAASNRENLNTTWYPIVRDAMLSAYERTCPHKTARQIQAYALGLKKLHLKKLEDADNATP